MGDSVQETGPTGQRRATLRSGMASLTSTARRAAFIRRGGCPGGSTR
ncbi:DUF6380 family protein [Streptomyces turgidiscabies]